VISVVVPTIGRPSLAVLLDALAGSGPPDELILVDDRRDRSSPLVEVPAALEPVTRVVPGPARGPAAARNTGWRHGRYPWIAFLDDDVVPSPTWLDDLRTDLTAADRAVVGVQGVIDVPLPADRRPTDWEQVTAGLALGRWITADMAYRRTALDGLDGFDERFPRAFREDAEIAARMQAAGGHLAVGSRRCTHPVRAESPWVSLRTQAGNADDALLRRLYGRRWRERLDVPPGRRRRHAAVTAAAVAALAAAPLARHSHAARRVAIGAGLAWLAGTAEFVACRVAPGPRTPREVALMAVTSVVIPPLAVALWLGGWWRWRRATAMPA
jgi:glycosyltransferase involved in cell wall biosynthesis